MNNANGGNVIYKFKGDTSDVDKKKSTLEKSLKSAGALVGSVFVAGTAVAMGAVSKFVSDATKSFAEFEQLQGGLEAMLDDNKEAIDRVSKASQDAYKDLQMSQNQYLQAFEGSYAIVKNSISDTGDAIQTTNDALQLQVDLFNTFGGTTEQYATAINWALKGTYSYLDNLNLGIVGTKEGFQKAAEECGYLNKSVDELTSDEKIDIIKQYAEKTGVWGRSTQEASQTISGSLNMLKSSWSNLINEFGKDDGDIEGAFDKFIESAETFGKNIMPVLERILNSVIEHLPSMVQTIAQALPGLLQNLIPPLIQSAVDILKALVDAMPDIVNVLVDMFPIILNALLEGLLQIIIAIAEQLPELIPQIVDAIMEIIPTLIDNLPLFIEAGYKLIGGLAIGLIKAIPTLLSKAPRVWGALWNYFKTMPGKMIEIGKDLLKGLWNGIKDTMSWIVDKIKGLGKTILKAVKGIFGVHSPSTEFEFIGRMNMTGLEKGMKDMQPEIQKTIDSLFDLSPSLTGNMDAVLSPTVIVNNNVDMKTDPLGQTVASIKTFANGSKNDYNYGLGV